MKAALLDFSGTLFDDTAAVRPEALGRWCAAHGRAVSPEEAGRLRAAILARVGSAEGLAARRGCDTDPDQHRRVWTELAASAPGCDRVVGEAFYGCLTDPSSWRPYPDVRAVLAALRGLGVAVGVVSNTGWDIRGSFRAAGLSGLVDDFVLSCELGVEKPDPVIFHAACARLGVAPREALMVGDDPVKDGGAVAAGLSAYLLPAGRRAGRPRGLDRILPLFGVGPPARGDRAAQRPATGVPTCQGGV